MEGIVEGMKGHFVPCEEDDLLWDPESPKAWALPLFFRCRKRRVPTNDGRLVWTPLKCLTSQERRSESEGERGIWFVTSGVWDMCLYVLSFIWAFFLYSLSHTLREDNWVFPHISNLEECLRQALLSSQTSGGACISVHLTEGHKSREMLLKDRISPARNPYFTFPA